MDLDDAGPTRKRCLVRCQVRTAGKVPMALDCLRSFPVRKGDIAKSFEGYIPFHARDNKYYKHASVFIVQSLTPINDTPKEKRMQSGNIITGAPIGVTVHHRPPATTDTTLAPVTSKSPPPSTFYGLTSMSDALKSQLENAAKLLKTDPHSLQLAVHHLAWPVGVNLLGRNEFVTHSTTGVGGRPPVCDIVRRNDGLFEVRSRIGNMHPEMKQSVAPLDILLQRLTRSSYGMESPVGSPNMSKEDGEISMENARTFLKSRLLSIEEANNAGRLGELKQQWRLPTSVVPRSPADQRWAQPSSPGNPVLDAQTHGSDSEPHMTRGGLIEAGKRQSVSQFPSAKKIYTDGGRTPTRGYNPLTPTMPMHLPHNSATASHNQAPGAPPSVTTMETSQQPSPTSLTAAAAASRRIAAQTTARPLSSQLCDPTDKDAIKALAQQRQYPPLDRSPIALHQLPGMYQSAGNTPSSPGISASPAMTHLPGLLRSNSPRPPGYTDTQIGHTTTEQATLQRRELKRQASTHSILPTDDARAKRTRAQIDFTGSPTVSPTTTAANPPEIIHQWIELKRMFERMTDPDRIERYKHADTKEFGRLLDDDGKKVATGCGRASQFKKKAQHLIFDDDSNFKGLTNTRRNKIVDIVAEQARLALANPLDWRHELNFEDIRDIVKAQFGQTALAYTISLCVPADTPVFRRRTLHA